NPAATHAFMMADSMAAGVLAAVILHAAPMRWFFPAGALAVLLISCALYLVYQAKYDPEDVDPELLKYPVPYIYIPF
ncbi:MAG: hypothetical protein HUJ54_12470, partial [Erysipelotrichaceae bacterium]|nr:hypothetical protein [Erysipelotrichaceae bacterium]